MKVKLLNDVNVSENLTLKKDSEFVVRQVSYTNLLGQTINKYQIINGAHSGKYLDLFSCIHVPTEEKKYTETQWKAQEDYWFSKLEQATEKTERAQEAVREITKQLANKNQEIKKLTFFIEALTIGLEASSKAIEVLRNSKAN